MESELTKKCMFAKHFASKKVVCVSDSLIVAWCIVSASSKIKRKRNFVPLFDYIFVKHYKVVRTKLQAVFHRKLGPTTMFSGSDKISIKLVASE